MGFGDCGDEIDLRALRWGAHIWTVCGRPYEDTPYTLARLDPERGVAERNWPLPGARYARSEGMLPGSQDRLGYVYDRRPGLAAGIAGTDGWLVAPQTVVDAEVTDLLGMAWLGEALEVAAVVMRRQIHIATVSAQGVAVRRPSLETICPDDKYCEPIAAFRTPAGWRFWVQINRGLESIGEDGSRDGPARQDAKDFHGLDYVNNLAHGVLPETVKEEAWLDDHGRLAIGMVPPPENRADALASGHFIVADGRVRRWPLWYERDEDGTSLQSGDPPVLVRELGRRSNVLTVAEVRDGKPRSRRSVARSMVYPDLPLVLPRAAGGIWLVDLDGEFAAVGSDGRRADPLGLRVHLRTRGTGDPRYDEYGHEFRLAYLLFAPILLAGLGLGVALLMGRRRHHHPAKLKIAWISAALLVYCMGGIAVRCRSRGRRWRCVSRGSRRRRRRPTGG
jgi:hypothetical protein